MSPRLPKLPHTTELSPRERQIVTLILRLQTNRAIAAELRCSIKTVEYHVSNILRKTGAESRTELIVRVMGGERIR
jgi:DNA-binding NarL/FixJ family response regulator